MPTIQPIVEKIANIDHTIGYAEGILSKYELLFAGNLALIGISIAVLIGGVIYIKFETGKLESKIKDTEKKIRMDMRYNFEKFKEATIKDVDDTKVGALYANIKMATFLYRELEVLGKARMLSIITTALLEAKFIRSEFLEPIIALYEDMITKKNEILTWDKTTKDEIKYGLSIVLKEVIQIISDCEFEKNKDVLLFEDIADKLKEFLKNLNYS